MTAALLPSRGNRRSAALIRAVGAGASLAALLLVQSPGCGSPPETGLDEAAVEANNRGVGLMGQFDFEAARVVFDDLARKHAENRDIQVNLAVAILNRQGEGDGAEALAMLSEVLETDPGNMRALYCSGILELHRGDAAAAAAHFRKVLGRDTEDPDGWYFLGKALMQLSRYEEALEAFNAARLADSYLQSATYGAVMALRNLGRAEEATGMIGEFQRLKENPRARLLEFKYTKQGRLAEAVTIDASPPPVKVKPPGPLFEAVRPLAVAGEAVPWRRPSASAAPRSSMTVADVNGDGEPDVFITGAVSADGGTANALLLAEVGGGGYRLDGESPLASQPGVNAALWGDVDNDGLTDVYLCRRGPNQLWRRRGPSSWEKVTDGPLEGGARDTVDGILYDADHDGDLDLFLVNADGPNEMLINNRDGTFRPIAGEYGLSGSGAPSRLAFAADLDGDRDADLVVVNERPPHEVYRNDRLWSYAPAEGFSAFIASDISAAVAGDGDGDGRPEIYTVDEQGGLLKWSRGAGGDWVSARLTGPSAPERVVKGGRPYLALTDIDGDGARDLIAAGLSRWQAWPLGEEGFSSFPAVAEEPGPGIAAWAVMSSLRGPALLSWSPGSPPLLRAPGGGRHGFANLSLSGSRGEDSQWRSNASGIGARMAVRRGSVWTVLDTFRGDSGPGQGLQPVVVGLGGTDRIDFVALDWSDGVFQTELDLAGGEHHRIIETQRQLSSCPVLFAWDGEGFEFVSDLLGVGGIGYAVAPGEYATPRPRESFMLPEGLPAARDGRLALKLTEPMEEVAYLDAVRLTAYDLPPGWSMTLDERMGIGGPAPSGRPIFFRSSSLPNRVVNDRGEDVTAAVSTRDLRAAPVGELDRRFIGRLRQNHVLTMRFAVPLDEHPGRPVLVADGWVEYPYSQTSFAAWQAGAPFLAPTLEARGADGNWQVVADQFGYPAGMPRQMALPLPPLPKGARELRITTNQEVYWDRIAVVFEEECDQATSRVLPLEEAKVEQVGFPRRSDGDQRLPGYDYSRRAPLWDTRVPEGFYTRLGPVGALLEERDGASAIFGPGEGVHLEFAGPGAPVAKGWARALTLEVFGWCKDMDLFTNTGDTVEPLPLPEGIEDPGPLHREHNTRYLFGRR